MKNLPALQEWATIDFQYDKCISHYGIPGNNDQDYGFLTDTFVKEKINRFRPSLRRL
jgi:hypothetical protein